jgi:hypothetical protein
MTKGVKIFLGIGCGVLLIGAVVIVIGIIGLNYLESRFAESTKKVEIEGREFGQTTDQQGCISEGMRKSKTIGILDLSDSIALSAFTDACLETSKPTSGFCEGVPSFWSMKDSEWGAAKCRKAGIDPERTACIHVTKRQHQFCTKPF